MSLTIEAFDPVVHDVEALTDLLHQAYAPLHRMGLHFWATTQPASLTLKRLTSGQGLVALEAGQLLGTITYYASCPDNDCRWYQRPDVGRFGQFAVHPQWQGAGIGQRLLQAVMQLARTDAKRELALDTSQQAQHLRDYYQRLGFREVDSLQWHDVNYRSVVMSKSLLPG